MTSFLKNYWLNSGHPMPWGNLKGPLVEWVTLSKPALQVYRIIRRFANNNCEIPFARALGQAIWTLFRMTDKKISLPNPDEPEPKIYFTAEHAEDTEKTIY